MYSCYIPYSIAVEAISTSDSYKTWIVSAINDFNDKDTYLKFGENNSENAYGKLRIQFLTKENFLKNEGQGVFSFSSYDLTRVDSSFIFLNSDFQWTEGLMKKAIAYHVGQMLDLPYNGSDKESIMNPDLTQTYKGLSAGDIQSFQFKFNSALLSASITKGSVSARSISLIWNTNTPKEYYIKGSGLCWSSTNREPTINDEKNFYAGNKSGGWATGWNKRGSTVYFRSYFVTECETVYSPVIEIYVPESDTWEAGELAPFSSRRGAAVITTEGIFGKAFIIGGKLSSTNELTNEVWMHQPGLKAWKQVKSFPGTKREFATALLYQDKIYYGLGYVYQNFTYPIDWWEYNTTNDTWTKKENASPIGRPGAVGFSTSAGGILSLGLNVNTATTSTSTMLYNAANDSWSYLTNFPVSSGYKGYCTNNDTPYILLPTNRLIGFNKGGNYWFEADAFPFDNPTSNTIGNQENTMVACQGKIYYGSKNILDWFQYSPATNSWTKKSNSPTHFISTSTIYSIGDKIYVLDGTSKRVWEYNVD
ncbi:Kelch repeat-containing protein [Dyadobacter chenhuakuii]|uniref:Uncharacterized protein n=1 Tax=Dyadobacter chenhuakuii TaxID=2909339 RepID=A0ABY4XN06_9BACT|nr:kelch repeat-containing protein [Dyadobacter chenhuakuii]MCF2494272.1 hypothetical protein [Dyadobacter chenhuakuii]USJ31397.1 hypothetical protein NFI80_01385 [Dyadobacter chenhuakuii]